MAFKNKQGSSKGFWKEPPAPLSLGLPTAPLISLLLKSTTQQFGVQQGGPQADRSCCHRPFLCWVSPPPCPDPENTQHPPRPGVRSALPPPAPGSAQVSLGAQNLAREPFKCVDRTSGISAASPCPHLAGQSADMLTQWRDTRSAQ